MITGSIRNQIDEVWNAFWSGGIANPLEVIEQITCLLFIRRPDELQTPAENRRSVPASPSKDPSFRKEPMARAGPGATVAGRVARTSLLPRCSRWWASMSFPTCAAAWGKAKAAPTRST